MWPRICITIRREREPKGEDNKWDVLIPGTQLHVRGLSRSYTAAACWSGMDSEQFNLELIPILVLKVGCERSNQYYTAVRVVVITKTILLFILLEAARSLPFRRKKKKKSGLSGAKKNARSDCFYLVSVCIPFFFAQMEQAYDLFLAFTHLKKLNVRRPWTHSLWFFYFFWDYCNQPAMPRAARVEGVPQFSQVPTSCA